MTDAANLLSGLEEHHQTVRGCRVRAFCRTGIGPPLLLVHGYGGAAWNFSELVPFLGDRPLIVPDLPGHGGSAPLPAASIGAFADVLAAQILATGLAEPVDVFGHSMGGVVALRLAERRPELVRRLVLAAAAGISSSTRLAELTITAIGIVQPARIAGRRADRIAGSRRLRRLLFGGYEVSNPDSLTERSVHGLLRGPTMHTDAIGAGKALAAEDPRLDLDRVRCPVLVLSGARDRQVPLADAFEYARRLHAPLRLIADCGHLLISERPEVCARACISFLGGPSLGKAVLG
ncbi:MAG: alpha/beta hydrolase [Actinobacteria bacterium]|nr:alpha/beta hydrolase [Actinomycetota bacterium]